MDVIARLDIGDNGCNPLSQSIHFDSMCATHIISCYGAQDYTLLQATQSLQLQHRRFADDTVTFLLKYDKKET